MEELGGLLLAIYGMAREVPLDLFHDRALALVKSVVPFRSAIWGTGAMTSDGLVYHTVHLHNEPDDLQAAYQAVRHQDDASFRLSEQGLATVRFHAPTLHRDRSKSAIRAYAARYGHQNYIVSSEVRAVDRAASWVALYRADPDHQYSEEERRVVAFLGPHMREAFRINCAVHVDSAFRDSDETVLAVADARGVICHAHPHFPGTVREELPCWEGLQLPREWMSTFGAGGRRWVGARVVAECKSLKDLLFIQLRRRRSIDALTEQERRVAEQLAQGRTYKEIARVLQIAPSTARNHIQAIHRKLEISSNAAVASHLAGAGPTAPSAADKHRK